MKPLAIRTRTLDTHITLSSVRKLKLALLHEEGGITTVPLKTVPRKEFDRRMKRVREMEQLDLVCGRHYGPGW